MCGTLRVAEQLSNRHVLVEFIFCNQVAALAIFGADFSDIFVKSIRPRRKRVELVDGTAVPTTRRPFARPPYAPIPASTSQKESRRPTPTSRVARDTTIEPGSHSLVLVPRRPAKSSPRVRDAWRIHTERSGFRVPGGAIQYYRCAFSKVQRRLTKGQVIVMVLAHPTAFFPSHISIGEILCIAVPASDINEAAQDPATAESAESREEDLGTQASLLDNLDLSHVALNITTGSESFCCHLPRCGMDFWGRFLLRRIKLNLLRARDAFRRHRTEPDPELRN